MRFTQNMKPKRNPAPVSPDLAAPAVLAAVLLGSIGARGVVLDLPDLVLLPDQADQSFVIHVHNPGLPLALTGVQLELATAGGGPAAGGTLGPAIQGGSLVAVGLLFAGNNSGDEGAGILLPQVFERVTETASGTVTLPTLALDGPGVGLATVVFDTRGVPAGEYTWTASSGPNGSTIFVGEGTDPTIAATFFGGTLTVVPEVAEMSVLGGLALAGFAGWRRFRLCRGASCPAPAR